MLFRTWRSMLFRMMGLCFADAPGEPGTPPANPEAPPAAPEPVAAPPAPAEPDATERKLQQYEGMVKAGLPKVAKLLSDNGWTADQLVDALSEPADPNTPAPERATPPPAAPTAPPTATPAPTKTVAEMTLPELAEALGTTFDQKLDSRDQALQHQQARAAAEANESKLVTEALSAAGLPHEGEAYDLLIGPAVQEQLRLNCLNRFATAEDMPGIVDAVKRSLGAIHANNTAAIARSQSQTPESTLQSGAAPSSAQPTASPVTHAESATALADQVLDQIMNVGQPTSHG